MSRRPSRKPVLTWKEAQRARALYGWHGIGGRTISSIASMFDVSNATIFKAVHKIHPYDKKENLTNAENRP